LSYPTHLIRVNSRFYYKIKVPADLSHLFPSRFIKKSLFTDQLHAAKTMLTSYIMGSLFIKPPCICQLMFPLLFAASQLLLGRYGPVLVGIQLLQQR